MKFNPRNIFKKKSKKPERMEDAKNMSRFERHLVLGFVIGLSMGLIMFICSIMLVTLTPYLSLLQDKVTYNSFNNMAHKYEDNDLVRSITYICSLRSDDYQKMYCVYKIINDNTKKGKHGKNINDLNTPESMFQGKNSSCRDVSVLFKSVMNNLNIKSGLILIPNHVYNKVYIEDYVYVIDIAQGKYYGINKEFEDRLELLYE